VSNLPVTFKILQKAEFCLFNSTALYDFVKNKQQLKHFEYSLSIVDMHKQERFVAITFEWWWA